MGNGKRANVASLFGYLFAVDDAVAVDVHILLRDGNIEAMPRLKLGATTNEPQTTTLSPQFVHVFTIGKSNFWLPNRRTNRPINRPGPPKNQ
jgi:hypothetical protein